MHTDVKQRLSELSEDQRRVLAQRLSARRRSRVTESGISRHARNGAPLPVSFAQQRFWFLNQLGALNAAFNVGECHRFKGSLDVAALGRSLNEIVRRHEALRTTFEVVDGQPVQRIAEAFEIDLPVEDLQHLDSSDRPLALRQRISEEGRRPWALDTGPLVRARLWRLSEDEHVFLVLLNHIIADGWSKNILVRELTALYQAFSNGRPSPLADLPIQYADFAVWQRRWTESDEFERQLSYWKRHLSELPVLKLARDGTRSTGSTGIHRVTVLPRALTQSVSALSQQEGVTLFMTLLAAFSILLSRYTGQRDIVVGSPIANRNRAELEDLIGCFMNPLPLRTRIDGGLTFRQLLAHVREVAVGTYANQDVPFDVLVRTLQPERLPNASPLFQVMFLLHNFSWQSMHLSKSEMGTRAISLDGLPVGEGEELEYPGDLIYPIVLEALEIGDRLLCCFEFSTQWALVFSRAPGHFRTMLEAIVANPDCRVDDLPLLTPAERRQLIEEWNPPARASAPGCVHELFERQAERQPDAVAVVASEGQVTYGELNARANRLAHWLRAAGVTRDARVGVLLDRSIDMVTALVAVLKAGGAYVPMDPAYPVERLAFMAGDSGMPLLLTTRALLDDRSELASSVRPGAIVCLDEVWDAISSHAETNPAVEIDPANLAYVIYTSGSTGTPKGVQVPHGSIANYTQVAADTFGLQPGDRVLQFASISFDTTAEEIFPCLLRGATLVLRTNAMLNSVPAFLRQCREWRISVLNFPTAYWHELTRQMSDGGFELPEDVRLTILGGERAQPERVRAWQARFGHRVRLINSYGPTETTIVATYFEVPPDDDERWSSVEVPIGRPIPNARVYVLDQRLQPVPIGVPGELYVGGAGVARGYLNQPALTAERFVPDPFGTFPGGRLYRTGDQARYLASGDIEFLGRVDDQVKIRGFRVELAEIEAALLRDAAVEHAAVLLREDQPNDRRLVAYVVPRESSVAAHELRTRLRAAIPDYMVPDVFVLLDAMPLTPNGKVDHAALPRPDGARQAAEAYVAPQTDVERRLAAIWAEVLRVERVGLDDNFFDLGGHSLLVIQLHSRLRDGFGEELSVIDLFKVPTVRSLAERLNRPPIAAEPAFDRLQDRANRQREAFQRRRLRPMPGAGVR